VSLIGCFSVLNFRAKIISNLCRAIAVRKRGLAVQKKNVIHSLVKQENEQKNKLI